MAIRFWVSCAWRGSQRRVFLRHNCKPSILHETNSFSFCRKGKGNFSCFAKKKKQIQGLVFKCNHLSIFFSNVANNLFYVCYFISDLGDSELREGALC